MSETFVRMMPLSSAIHIPIAVHLASELQPLKVIWYIFTVFIYHHCQLLPVSLLCADYHVRATANIAAMITIVSSSLNYQYLNNFKNASIKSLDTINSQNY